MQQFTCYPDLLTVQEAAEALRISTSEMEGLIAKGEIYYATIGTNTRISKPDLINYVEKCRHVCYDAATKMHLDNLTEADIMPCKEGETDMANRFNQAVIINGKKRWITAKSTQELVDKVASFLTVTPAVTSGHLFDTYAWNWFHTYSEPNIETVTATTYKRQIRNYLIPAFAGMNVEDITPDHVQRLFNGMAGAKATKEKARMVLNQIMQAALEDNLISANPVKSRKVKVSGKASKTTEPYSVEQMRFLVQHIGDIKKPGDRAFLALQMLHPLRLEEVLGLKGGDVNTDDMSITVRRAVTHPTRNQPEIKDTKNTSSHRTIGLSALALEHIPSTPADDFILGGKKPLSYTVVRKICNRIQQDTGFETTITPIRFRTTVLTDMYAETKDIKLTQLAAGHTTSSTTLKYYVKGRQNVQTAAAAVDRVYSAPEQ